MSVLLSYKGQNLFLKIENMGVAELKAWQKANYPSHELIAINGVTIV